MPLEHAQQPSKIQHIELIHRYFAAVFVYDVLEIRSRREDTHESAGR
jgi:hypothetical protein